MESLNGTVPNNGKMGYGNEMVPKNGEYGNLEWNGPKQWRIWKSEIERSRTIKKNGIREWNGPNIEKNGLGMERSRTMEKMGYGNVTAPNIGENAQGEIFYLLVFKEILKIS